MRAAIYDRYGGPDVVHLADLPDPVPVRGEVLVRVRATSVTTADWRMRAAAYPGILWLPGRMITGFRRPKNPVLGLEFAGEVVGLGDGVSAPAPGTRVFGFSGKGAHAEYLVMPAAGPIVETPASLTDEEAAALPFGALSALVFLRDFAKVQPGQNVAVVGASGGVEFVISVLALLNQVAPPTINLDNPDPDCDLDYIPHQARPMRLDYVLSNSFGFGGHNACLLLAKAP